MPVSERGETNTGGAALGWDRLLQNRWSGPLLTSSQGDAAPRG